MHPALFLTCMGRTLPQTARNTDARDDTATRATRLLHLCADPQRRNALEALCEEGALTLDTLADHVAARERGLSVSDVPDDVSERIAIGLHHTHLQKLSQAGFVERTEDSEGTTVALTSAVEPDRVRDLIQYGDGDWEAIDALLRHDRRRHVVSLLASADGALSLRELTEAVVALEHGEAGTPHREPLEPVRVSLYHVHLPKLGDAGVLSYDAEDRLVTAESLPDVCEIIVDDDPEAAPA